MIEIGKEAPDFTLPDKNGEPVALSRFRGGKVVLYFYPKDNTPGCTRQACAFSARYGEFKKRGIEVVGVSRDSAASHLKFAEKFSLPFNLEEIMQLLEVLLHRLGELPLKMKVERFVLHWIATGQDPYLTARFFGVINAGLSQLAPIYAVRYPCRNSSVWTDIDFTRDNSFFECGLTATIRIGQALWSGLVIAFDVLKIYLKSRRRKKREKKEEEKALEKWLQEHPEDARLLEEETKDETKTDETEVESQIA